MPPKRGLPPVVKRRVAAVVAAPPTTVETSTAEVLVAVNDTTGSSAAAVSLVAKDHAFAAVALYDYAAADDDEVSFAEGDTLSHVAECGNEGWLTGTVHSTGATGTFPTAYVQRINNKSAAPAPYFVAAEDDGSNSNDGSFWYVQK